MGPAGRAGLQPDEANKVLPAALYAFPSPASTTASLDSPTLGRTLAGFKSPGPQWTPRSLLPDAANILPAEPTAAFQPQPLPTPPTDDRTHPDFNMMVGGALAPVHTTAPRRSQPKPGPGLRLPSFEWLGIAAPHPDRYGQNTSFDGAMSTFARDSMLGPLSIPPADSELLEAYSQQQMRAAGGLGSDESALIGGRAIQSPVKQFIATLTPPAETGEIIWPSMAAVTSIPMESPMTDPGMPMGSSPGASSPSAEPGAAAGEFGSDPGSTVPTILPRDVWIEGALDALLQSLRTAPALSNPLRVLSHALPSTSSTGHVFPSIISAIHDSTPTSPTTWINVFHAIPGRFNLADLPTSPPSTPGPPIGGEDYFTTKTFDSAVPISDYQQDLSSLPRSPRPVVPPSSINISVVERYIPPTSPNEFLDMFNANGPSILIDRLVELSPNNGCLAFIYPTRTGAQTFVRDYLEPIVAPLLRTVCVTHGLSFDLSRLLGSMSASDRLLEHMDMERQIARLCATLTQRSTTMQRFHGRRANFTLAYTAKKEVPLSREVWAKDWWTKQEKPRVRDIVTRYAQEAQKKSSNEHIDRPATPAELIQQLLDGVVNKAYPEGQTPTRGIEVSVFIIKRSS